MIKSAGEREEHPRGHLPTAGQEGNELKHLLHEEDVKKKKQLRELKQQIKISRRKTCKKKLINK